MRSERIMYVLGLLGLVVKIAQSFASGLSLEIVAFTTWILIAMIWVRIAEMRKYG